MDLQLVFLFVIFSYIAQMDLLATAADSFRNQYVGCFSNSVDFSITQGPMGTGDILSGMTHERCRSHCLDHTPSTFFAVRATDICHCGQPFNRFVHELKDDESCSARCNENSGELCGGELALRVYWVCPVGYYGSQCDSRCSLNCQNHTRLGLGCYLNGTCSGGCQDGWNGPMCDRNLGPMLVLNPPDTKSYSPPDGSFAWTCKVVNAAADVDYEVGWYSSNGTEIKNTAAESSHVYVEVESRLMKRLRVLQVPDWVAENYTCRENIAERFQAKDLSILFVRPFITKFLERLSATVGTNTTFSCEAQGLPRPQYRFFKGVHRAPVQSSNETVVDGRTGRLTFHAVQMKDDGVYTCEAFSDIGHVFAYGIMRVAEASGCLVNNGGCSQYCINITSESYKCICGFGYQLQDDGKTCRVYFDAGLAIGILLAIIAGAVVLLVIVVLVCKNRRRKNRQKALQPTAANVTTSHGRADEASGLVNHDDRT